LEIKSILYYFSCALINLTLRKKSMTSDKPKNIDEYISTFPKETQKIMEQVRETIKKTAPDAEETISYSMPAFNLNGTYLVYFAAYKNHIGFYPAPVADPAFKKDLSTYKIGKGSVQFPLKDPMPLALISKIVKSRMAETSKKPKQK
jgi:uncharacterized protein YdhG (YjbR/CyaY superfamily)